MKNLAFRVAVSMGAAFWLACGGVDPSPESSPAPGDEAPVEQWTPPSEWGEMTAMNHGCPRNAYACVNYCAAKGHRRGKCTGSTRGECTCTD